MSLPLPNATVAVNGPRITQEGQGGLVVRHRVLAKSVSLTPAAAGKAAASGMSVKVSPGTDALLGGGWLGRQAGLYDKYRFTEMTLSWQPAASLLFAGNVAVWYDPNPSAPVPGGYDAATGNYRVLTLHVAASGQLRIQPAQLRRLTWYVTTRGKLSHEAEDTQGVLQIAWSDILSDQIKAATAFTLGHLWLEFRLELQNPTA